MDKQIFRFRAYNVTRDLYVGGYHATASPCKAAITFYRRSSSWSAGKRIDHSKDRYVVKCFILEYVGEERY